MQQQTLFLLFIALFCTSACKGATHSSSHEPTSPMSTASPRSRCRTMSWEEAPELQTARTKIKELGGALLKSHHDVTREAGSALSQIAETNTSLSQDTYLRAINWELGMITMKKDNAEELRELREYANNLLTLINQHSDLQPKVLDRMVLLNGLIEATR